MQNLSEGPDCGRGKKNVQETSKVGWDRPQALFLSHCISLLYFVLVETSCLL